jgi:hypothetical protein
MEPAEIVGAGSPSLMLADLTVPIRPPANAVSANFRCQPPGSRTKTVAVGGPSERRNRCGSRVLSVPQKRDLEKQDADVQFHFIGVFPHLLKAR